MTSTIYIYIVYLNFLYAAAMRWVFTLIRPFRRYLLGFLTRCPFASGVTAMTLSQGNSWEPTVPQWGMELPLCAGSSCHHHEEVVFGDSRWQSDITHLRQCSFRFFNFNKDMLGKAVPFSVSRPSWFVIENRGRLSSPCPASRSFPLQPRLSGNN